MSKDLTFKRVLTIFLVIFSCFFVFSVNSQKYDSACAIWNHAAEKIKKNHEFYNADCKCNSQCSGVNCQGNFFKKIYGYKLEVEYCYSINVNPCKKPLNVIFDLDLMNSSDTFNFNYIPKSHFEEIMNISENHINEHPISGSNFKLHNTLPIHLNVNTKVIQTSNHKLISIKINGVSNFLGIKQMLFEEVVMPETIIPEVACNNQVIIPKHIPYQCLNSLNETIPIWMNGSEEQGKPFDKCLQNSFKNSCIDNAFCQITSCYCIDGYKLKEDPKKCLPIDTIDSIGVNNIFKKNKSKLLGLGIGLTFGIISIIGIVLGIVFWKYRHQKARYAVHELLSENFDDTPIDT